MTAGSMTSGNGRNSKLKKFAFGAIPDQGESACRYVLFCCGGGFAILADVTPVLSTLDVAGNFSLPVISLSLTGWVCASA